MVIVVLIMLIIGLAALATTVVTGAEVIVWVSIGACVVGLILLIVTAPREGQRPDDATVPRNDVAPFGPHIPDYSASSRPAADALIHDDHEIERDVVREERVLHLDTGPLDPDVSEEEAIESTRHTSYHGRRGRGNR
jgi:hypothetical protein